MKHFKLSNKLTLDKKLFVLMITFTVGLMNLSITSVTAAECNERYENGVLVERSGDCNSTPSDNSCESINDDLKEKIRSMTQACAATSFRGDCLSALLSCDQNMSGPESCDSLKETLGAMTTENYKDQVDAEKERLEAIEDKKSELQKFINEEQDKLDEINKQIADRKMERQALDRQLQDSIKTNDQQTANKINEIRAQASQLQTERDNVFTQLMDQRRQVTEFMMKEQLTCNQSAREEAKQFYIHLRMCSEGRKQGCNLSLQSLVMNGNNSYSAMANKYRRQKVRECMRTDSDSDFAVKYRAFMAQIDLNKDILNTKNSQINAKATELTQAIQLADAQGKLANSQLTIDAANSVKIHEEETQRLIGRAKMINDNFTAYKQQLADLDASLKLQQDVIKELRSGSSSNLGSEELANLRNAHMDAESLISEAQDAVAECGCTSEIQRISDRSGLNFCDSSTSESIEEPSFEDAAE